jgi:hypothetical protein
VLVVLCEREVVLVGVAEDAIEAAVFRPDLGELDLVEGQGLDDVTVGQKFD